MTNYQLPNPPTLPNPNLVIGNLGAGDNNQNQQMQTIYNAQVAQLSARAYCDSQNSVIREWASQYNIAEQSIENFITLKSLYDAANLSGTQSNIINALSEQLSQVQAQIPALILQNLQNSAKLPPILQGLTQVFQNKFQTEQNFVSSLFSDASQATPTPSAIAGAPQVEVNGINTDALFADVLTAFSAGSGATDINELLNAPEIDFNAIASHTSIEIINLLIQRLTMEMGKKASEANKLDAQEQNNKIKLDNERVLKQMKEAQEKQAQANSSASGGKIAGYVVAALGILAAGIITAVSLGTASAVAATIAVVAFAVTIAFTAASMSGGIDKAVEAAAKSVAGDDPEKLKEAKNGFQAMFAVIQVLIAVILAIASFGANIGAAVSQAAKIAADTAKDAGTSVAKEVAKAVAQEISNQIKNAMVKTMTLGLKNGTAAVTEVSAKALSTSAQIAASAGNLTGAGIAIAGAGTGIYSAVKSYQAAQAELDVAIATGNKEKAEAAVEAGREIIKVLMQLLEQIQQSLNDQIENISEVIETRHQANQNLAQQFSLA